eukprot:gene16723-19877_t
MFASQNVFNGHLKGKKHITLQEKLNNCNNDASILNHKSRKHISLFEYNVAMIGELLAEQVQETKDHIIKKQSRSYNPLDLEEEEEEEIDDIELDDEPAKLRIANYPVDWSGKPIPYWVYKLHELGVEYKCEICGNQSYWGRRAYEKHFQESRHSYGMSCIGVPNTTHFHHITKIKDALELSKKIKDINSTTQFRAERDEEYEDETGEVMSKKTYEMLVKQETSIDLSFGSMNTLEPTNRFMKTFQWVRVLLNWCPHVTPHHFDIIGCEVL